MKPIKAAYISAVLYLCPATSICASDLWGVTVGNSQSIVLREIDMQTGAVSGSISTGMGLTFTNVDDLASDHVRHPSVVWAVRNSIAGNELIAVNPYQQQLLSITLLDVPSPIRSLAIDPTDGAFYGATTASLYRIAPDTGMTALVGAAAMPVDKALGFNAQGNLFGIWNNNNLVSINKSTGATSLVSALNLWRMEDIAARPEDGVMFGLGFGYSLYQINVDTGELIEIGPSLGRPGGIAFTLVPEPSAAVLGAMAACALLAVPRAQFSRRPSVGEKK